MIGDKPAEEDPLRTAALLRAIGDASLDLIFAKDREGRLIYANAAYGRLVGRPVNEVLGLTAADIAVNAEEAERIMASERRILDSGVAEVLEEPFTTVDGVTRVYRSTRSPMRGPDGELLGLAVISTDITERKQGEEALRANERQLAQIADALPVLISYIDADQRYRFANKGYEDWFGIPAAKLRGMTIRELLGDEAYEKMRPLVDGVLRGERQTHESFMPYLHGGRHVHAEYIPNVAPDGSVGGYFVMVHDIGERKAAEVALHEAQAQLRESENRLRMAASAAEIGTWDYDPVADLLDWDATCKALFGIAPDEPVTYHGTFAAALHPEDRDATLAAVDAALAPDGPGIYDVEYRTVGRNDGLVRWVAATGRGIFEDGKAIRFIGTVHDIGDRKRAEAALHDETRALETLNRTGAALAAELDLEKLVQMVTDAGVEITGAQFGAFFYNVIDAAGESYMLYTLSGAHPSQFDFGMPRATPIFHPTFVGERVVRSDDIRKDPRYGQLAPHFGMPKGHLPVCSYLAVSVLSRTGNVIGGLFFGHPDQGRFNERHEQLMTAVAAQAAIAIDNAQLYQAAQQDVADRKRAEAKLRELNETLEQRIAEAIAERELAEGALRQAQKMEAVGQLTGGIAHDFNNLLTVVIGNIDMARRAQEAAGGDPRTKRALDHAQKGAERAASLTQRLLAFSRRQPLEPKSLDINRLVLGMSDLLGRAIGEMIKIEIVTSPGLWRVEADPNQLESAILNLAVNARDAMPAGGSLTIETANVRLDDGYAAAQAEVAPGPYVMVAVTDTGQGMSKDVLGRVFEPFFTTKDVGRGTGLGLSQVYGFVKQSGGHVKIYSEVDEGSTVKLYLPRLMAEDSAEEEVKPGAVEVGRPEETILVVEDDDDVRAFTVEILRAAGYRVLEAHDGPSALRLLERQTEPIDLLFTDVVMPGMSGRDLAEVARVRQPGVKVLFTSGYTRDAIVHGGRLESGVDMIAKPFTYQPLSQKVRDMLDKGQSGRLLCVQPEDTDSAICAALRTHGYAVDQSVTAVEALGRVRANAGRYDAVIVDEELKDRSGEGTANAIRSLFRDVPVMLLSRPKTANTLSQRFADDPCTEIAIKPIEPAQLLKQLEALGVRCAKASGGDGEAS